MDIELRQTNDDGCKLRLEGEISGLSRRDLFAAMAMQGCLAYSHPAANREPISLAQDCVMYADALIFVLDKK